MSWAKLNESEESVKEVQIAEEKNYSVLETDEKAKEELSRVVAVANEWNFLQQKATNSESANPLQNPKFIEARRQPKPKMEAENLARKYGLIKDTSERAYQILLDLGMVEASAPINMTKSEGIIDMDKKEE